MTSPICVTSSRPTAPASTAWASSPPALACVHSSQKSWQRRMAPSSTSALPCASAPRAAMCWPGCRSAVRDHRLVAGGHGHDDLLCDGLFAAPSPTELVGERLCDLGPGVVRRYPSRSRRPPGSAPPTLRSPRSRRRRPSSRPPGRGPVPRPRRRPRCEARSPTRTRSAASSSPVTASETRIAPRTTGSPRALLPGNDVTHLRIASPSPRAGIARKSPSGRAVDVDLRRASPTHPPRGARTRGGSARPRWRRRPHRRRRRRR